MKKKLLFCLLLFSVVFKSAAQDTEFWFVAPDVSERHGTCDSPAFMVISNPSDTETATNIELTLYSISSSPYPVTASLGPRQSVKIDFDRSGTYNYSTRFPLSAIENPRNSVPNSALSNATHNYGVKITSQGAKVSAYYQVDGSCSKDIWALKGEPALGKTGDYFIVPMQADRNYNNAHATYYDTYDQIDIVAAESSTIRFTLKKDACGYPAGTTHTVTLNKGQTLKLMEDTIPYPGATNASRVDFVDKKESSLGGSKIEVVSGTIAVTVTEDGLTISGGNDVVGDQIVPVCSTGTQYVVIKGYTSNASPRGGATDRVYIFATENGTTVNIDDGAGGANVIITNTNRPDYSSSPYPVAPYLLSPVSSPVTLNEGQFIAIDMGDNSTGTNVVKISSPGKPVYCYHVSGVGGELGSALLPSVFSIGQQTIAFYQSNLAQNNIFLVFRDTCESYFELTDAGGIDRTSSVTGLTSTAQAIPSTPDWKYSRLNLSTLTNNQLNTLTNSESAFSLGYFNYGGGTSGYGYLSGFAPWEFSEDTIWRCADNPRPVTLMGGYALSYKWTLPNGSVKTTPSIKAYESGKYILEMDQDPRIVTDSVWIIDMQFDAAITREPNKPAKVGVPQIFRAAPKGTNLPALKYHWTFEGGTPATSTVAVPKVTWNSTGEKTVTLKLSAKGGVGVNEVACDTTIIMDLLVRPKNNGYFVDQNVSGGLHDGSNWQNAFVTVQEALELASQGDYVWVAKGEYSPFTDNTYIIDYDSVSIYGGFGAWEANLDERNFTANPTILNGRNSSVITFDGGTSYTNGFCGVGTGAVLDGFIIQGGRTANGAGVLFKNGASGTVSNCIIRNNYATQDGGGLYPVAPTCGHDSPVFFNLEVSGNTAVNGAGIYNNGSDFTATNITVSGNKATSTGGLYNSVGNPQIRNTIIWGNRDNSGTDGAMDITVASGTPVYTYSIIGGSKGSGSGWNVALGTDAGKNLDVSPLFRRTGFDDYGAMRQGIYQLAGTSKAVNTGRNNFVLLDNRLLKSISLLTPSDTAFISYIPNDLDGGNRIEYDIVDRGAYEYYKDSNDEGTVHQVFIPVVDNITTDPETGLYWVGGHESFVLTLYPKEGYSLQYVEITTGSKRQDEEGAMQVVYNEDGSVTVTFREVTEPINVQLKGITPVSNDMIDSSYAIWTGSNRLHVRTTKAGTLKVYTLTGAMLKQQELSEGEASFPLSQGVYIVTFNDGYQQKVVVK